ncbi:MAG TPA: hypothetical protein VK947_08305 [Planococcus sp. (in: firmicutes)]|nr:hypothetical protein [Planococcus sp. (in: firmicutes)]
MEPRKNKNWSAKRQVGTNSQLSPALLPTQGKALDKEKGKLLDAFTNAFLFVLGGIILCMLLYGVITYL